MFKDHKRICIAIICLVMLGIAITGCSQQEKNEPPISKGLIQEAAAPDSSQKDNTFITFYPSGSDFIKTIIDKRGKVEITDEMRKHFNLFARDYRFFYMPDMNYYESFFEANQYAKSFGYNNFGFAVFYVLQYMRCPEKMSDEAMQNAIQNLFVAKESYKNIPHQAFRKLANYEDGYYSPWPEGGLDHDRMFYLLTGLDIVQEESNNVYITVRTKSYYFNDTNVYEAGENEKWLAEKSKKLGVPDLQAAAKLITSGEMEGLKGDREFETTISIYLSEQSTYAYNPRFVSSRSLGIK